MQKEEKSNTSQLCACSHDFLGSLGAICKDFFSYDVGVNIGVSSAVMHIRKF